MKKLELKKESVRVLVSSDLSLVQGGGKPELGRPVAVGPQTGVRLSSARKPPKLSSPLVPHAPQTGVRIPK